MHQNLILIGGGNMGGAMATRWQHSGAATVHVVEQDAARRDVLSREGIACYARIEEAPLADLYVLAIKPQQFAAYVPYLRAALGDASPHILSIMAGITLSDLQVLSPYVVRVMPNLPALIGESMSVLCAAPQVAAPAREHIAQLFTHIGAIAWVEEEAQLHTVTAISGSGPAYVFALMEALQHAALAQGLHAALAQKLVTQTVRGAALLADQSPENAATLRAQVTSKGGTTEAALNCLAQGGLTTLVERAVAAAQQRSEELSAAQ